MLLPLLQNNLLSAAASVDVSGTLDGSLESDIVAGGKTLILTLTGDTWVASGATFDAQRQNIIDGLDSAQSETNGWNNVLRDSALQVTDVARTSDTVVTITLPAASYDITAAEVITVTVPATALTGGVALVAPSGISISPVAAAQTGGRSRRKYVVEVDGELIQVASLYDAEQVLRQVRELAEESAERDVTSPITPKPPKVKVLTAKGNVSTSKTIQAAVKKTQKAINTAYREAAKRREVDREISQLMTRKIAMEEEEDAILLLLIA